MIKKITALCLCLILCVSLFACEKSENRSKESAPKATADGYLTTKGMFELSDKDNIVVFLIDRFDDYYYRVYTKQSSEITEKLDGFTYYSDNITTYPRTYPGIASMVTGVETDFSMSRVDYLEYAYANSDFLKDLQANNYSIKLYLESYYAYDDVPLVVENKHLTGSGKAEFPKYEENDPEFYESFASSGLTTQSEKNNFTFYHLYGCHFPFTMDENCNPVAEEDRPNSAYPQIAGCFKIIYEYIDEMKRLGIYENSTIIITGDHGALFDGDKKTYSAPKLTALMVKEKGQSGTPMKTSDAPVSQTNLCATIVKSAGLETDKDYGLSYSEVTSENTPVRVHYFQSWGTDVEMNYKYEITGSGRDFDNWRICEEPKEIKGGLYGNK